MINKRGNRGRGRGRGGRGKPQAHKRGYGGGGRGGGGRGTRARSGEDCQIVETEIIHIRSITIMLAVERII